METTAASSEGGEGVRMGGRKRWVKGRHKWKWLRPKSWPIMRHRRETLALVYEFAMWDQLSDEALLNFEQQMSARVKV